MTVIEKKLFKHGGSYAVDLPKEFVGSGNTEIIIKYDKDRLIIVSKNTLENIESEPEFKMFVQALVADSLKNPHKLQDMNGVWDKEWDALLKDVDAEDE
jgi:virulence-associated protein VagC